MSGAESYYVARCGTCGTVWHCMSATGCPREETARCLAEWVLEGWVIDRQEVFPRLVTDHDGCSACEALRRA